MRTHRFSALGAAGAVLVSAACIIPVYIDDPWNSPRSSPRLFEKTVPWDRGGPIAVENPVGDVDIFGWDEREVQISAEWGWDATRGRRIGLFDGRDVPDVDVDVIDGVLSVRLRRDGREDESVSPVRFVLNVPRSVDLKEVVVRRGRITVGDIYGRSRLAVEEGDVRIENYSGSLDISVGRGSAEAEILDLRPEDVVRVAVRQGSVIVLLEPEVAARIEAEAPKGRITSDFDLGPEGQDRKAAAVLGRGPGAAVTLLSEGGDIRLRKIRDGY